MLRFFCFIICACLLQCVRFEEISSTAPEKEVTVNASNLTLVDGTDFSLRAPMSDTLFFNHPDSTGRLSALVTSEKVLRIDLGQKPSGCLFRNLDTNLSTFFLKFDLMVEMKTDPLVEIRIGLAGDTSEFSTRFDGITFEVRPDSVKLLLQAGQDGHPACKATPAGFNAQWFSITLWLQAGRLCLEENSQRKVLLSSPVYVNTGNPGLLQYLFVKASGLQTRFYVDNIYLYK